MSSICRISVRHSFFDFAYIYATMDKGLTPRFILFHIFQKGECI